MQALWMVLASFFFASMALGIKFASSSFGTMELVFYRGVVSIVFMGLVVRARGIPLRTPVPMMHLWRSIIGVLSMGAWFYAIAHLPLATAMTLNYMSGVWVAAFIVGGALLYGGLPHQGRLLGTVLLGFAGVILTLRPTIDHNQLFAGVVGLLSGMGAALAYLQVTALGKAGEPEERIVFYFSIGAALVGVVGALFTGLTPWTEVRLQAAAWLIPIGVLASLGQWCMTRAYSQGATLVVASMQYSGIVFASLYSVLLFDDKLPLMGWAGIAVILASGVLATILRARVLPGAPAERH
jgi:S-adenosylmethionine uptake transporter